MLMEQTLQDLRSFKLTGMADALTSQLEQPKSYDLSFEERLSLLVEAEKIYRKGISLDRIDKELTISEQDKEKIKKYSAKN